MSTARYARPRLITPDDKRYRAFVEQFLLQRQNQRAMRPPRQRDIFGGQAETALRDWLAAQMPLAETRILEYEERRGRRASTKYRELDALVLEDRRNARVFEIKASRKAGSLRRAVMQLQETRAILRLLYQRVAVTVLLVDTGIPTAEEVTELMRAPEAPETPPQTLDEVLEALPQVHLADSLEACQADNEAIDLLRFTVDDIIALAGAENLALDWEADEEEEPLPAPPPDTGPAYSTGAEESEEESDNPLAAALRRAGLTNEE